MVNCMLKLDQIQIDNFYSFANNLSIKNISNISVFVGPNNSGKSNLFRTMEFYKELLYDDDKKQKFVNIKKFYHQLNQNRGFSLSIEYLWNETWISQKLLRISHVIDYNKEGNFESEIVSIKDENNDNLHDLVIIKKENRKFLKQNKDLVQDFLNNNSTNSEQIDLANTSFEEIQWVYYAPFQWENDDNSIIGKIYNKIKNFVSSWKIIESKRSVNQDYDRIFSELCSSDREKANLRIKSICEFLSINDINFISNNGNKVSQFKENQNIKNTLKNLGSGLEQIYRILPEIIDISTSVFFIEEPELHLHASMQRKLLYDLIEISQNCQIFINTHSPIFCHHGGDDTTIFIVKKINESTRIQKIDSDRLYEIKSLLGHVNIDLFVYNAVLIVEGATEYNALHLTAKKLDIDLMEDGIIILDSKGYDNLTQIENILKLFRESDIEIYILCDNHLKTNSKFSSLENLVSKNHITILTKGFEDEFDNNILIDAFKYMLDEKSISITSEETNELLKKLNNRKNKSVVKVFEDFLHDKAIDSITIQKPDLGSKIVKVLEEKGQLKESVLGILIYNIHKDIKNLYKQDKVKSS